MENVKIGGPGPGLGEIVLPEGLRAGAYDRKGPGRLPLIGRILRRKSM